MSRHASKLASGQYLLFTMFQNRRMAEARRNLVFPQRMTYLPANKNGGAERDRTADPLLAKQVLSQLSYSPNCLVGPGRLELPTSRLSGVRSNQLSYGPSPHEPGETRTCRAAPGGVVRHP